MVTHYFNKNYNYNGEKIVDTGYILVKFNKTITLLMSSKDPKALEDLIEKNEVVVEYFRTEGSDRYYEYIVVPKGSKINNKVFEKDTVVKL